MSQQWNSGFFTAEPHGYTNTAYLFCFKLLMTPLFPTFGKPTNGNPQITKRHYMLVIIKFPLFFMPA